MSHFVFSVTYVSSPTRLAPPPPRASNIPFLHENPAAAPFVLPACRARRCGNRTARTRAHSCPHPLQSSLLARRRKPHRACNLALVTIMLGPLTQFSSRTPPRCALQEEQQHAPRKNFRQAARFDGTRKRER